MRTIALALFLCSPLIGQDMGGGAAAKNDCDCKTLEKGWYCKKCDALVEKADLDKDGKHSCKEAPAEVKVCVKKYYHAECCGTKAEDAGS